MTPQSGFEDALASLPVGTWVTGRGRTITAAEMTLLAAVSQWGDDEMPVSRALDADSGTTHLEPHLALAVVLSLAAASPLFTMLEAQQHLTVLAALRHSAVLHGPIPAGCTLTTRSAVTAFRKSAGTPGRAVVTVRDEAHDENGKAVMSIDRVVLMRYDAPADATGADATEPRR